MNAVYEFLILDLCVVSGCLVYGIVIDIWALDQGMREGRMLGLGVGVGERDQDRNRGMEWKHNVHNQ